MLAYDSNTGRLTVSQFELGLFRLEVENVTVRGSWLY